MIRMKLAFLFAMISMLCACNHPPVRIIQGEDDKSVVAAIERYQMLGAPGENADHEIATGVVAVDYPSAKKAIIRAIVSSSELEGLRSATSEMPLGKTKNGFYYAVASSSKHVYLMFIRENTDKIVWIALM